MLKRAKHNLFDLDNVHILNASVTTYFPNFDFHNTVIVIQKIE